LQKRRTWRSFFEIDLQVVQIALALEPFSFPVPSVLALDAFHHPFAHLARARARKLRRTTAG
jgi:hypothetical protein